MISNIIKFLVKNQECILHSKEIFKKLTNCIRKEMFFCQFSLECWHGVTIANNISSKLKSQKKPLVGQPGTLWDANCTTTNKRNIKRIMCFQKLTTLLNFLLKFSVHALAAIIQSLWSSAGFYEERENKNIFQVLQFFPSYLHAHTWLVTKSFIHDQLLLSVWKA